MDPLIYKIIHLAGVMGLFTALGSVISGTCGSCKKSAAILHGVSLVLIFVSGFGMMAKLGFSYGSGWFIVKAVLFLVLGAFLTVAKKELLPKPAQIGIILAVGIIAAYLGVMKPF